MLAFSVLLAFCVPLSAVATLTADGLEFSISKRDSYKHKTFSIGGVTLTDNWGFVHNDVVPLDHRGYEEVMGQCKFESMTMHEYGSYSTVNYYPSSASFSKYDGIDMIPENKRNYVRGVPFEKLKTKHDNDHGKNPLTVNGETVMMHQCKVPMPESEGGGAWHVQRVGPFTSTGGYDWWQIGWSDAGMISEVIEKQHPEGVDIESAILVPVDESGQRIGHPPIHIHHIHFVRQNGVRFRNQMRGFCVSSTGTTSKMLDSYTKEQNCYNSSLYLEQHGDYQCTPEDDGVECLTTHYLNNPRRISEAMDLEGELNDVRPFNSPPMRWYYQIALRWRPIQPEKTAMSQQTIMAPGNVDRSDQLSRVMTFPTPTDAPRFMYYTGHFWGSGELIRNKLHAHNLVFESSMFFAATREQLGLLNPEFEMEHAYQPKLISEIGFKDSDELIAKILDNLRISQERYDEVCAVVAAASTGDVSRGDGGNQVKSAAAADAEDEKKKLCSAPRPKFVCAAVYNSNVFPYGEPPKDFKFDRRPLTWCDDLSFEEGDEFVVISTSRKLTEAPIPPFPNRIPPTIPGHVSWHFWYKHKGWFHSFFGRIICNHEGIYFDADKDLGFLDTASLISAVLVEGGIPKTFFTRRVWWWVILGVLVALLYFFARMLAPKRKQI